MRAAASVSSVTDAAGRHSKRGAYQHDRGSPVELEHVADRKTKLTGLHGVEMNIFNTVGALASQA